MQSGANRLSSSPGHWSSASWTPSQSASVCGTPHPQWPGFDFSLGWDDDWIYHPYGGPTVGPDHTHPCWREFWLVNQAYWLANGVDGIFFDSFNPMPPNYALRPWPGQIGLEINNLQREARRRNREINPDFFSMTEGSGYLMATVNDFTHIWHGCIAPN